ncbi:MAG TPA: hypothetical protein VH518_13455 [Tepidisphaeraceae bacterium]|jgi:hypothetical protein
MSCWVVPSVAAELWGISVERILEGTRAGEIPSKTELGRMFVDVAPDSPKLQTPKALRPPLPPTYTLVTAAELEALLGHQEDEHTIELADFRAAREGSEKLRRRPLAA